jgi:predicted RNA-binding protein with RPS1 domain
MGVIREIEDYSMFVSLPNGVPGTVKLGDVSKEYVRYLKQQASNAEDPDEEGDSMDEEADVEVKTLRDIFTVGQHVVCAVKAVHKGDKVKVELTLDPTVINKHLEAAHLVQVGCWHLCSIR